MKKTVFPLVFFMVAAFSSNAEEYIKPAALAGSWYPAGRTELAAMIDGFLSNAPPAPLEAEIGAIVSPHAGFVFSGPIAAYGFRAAQARKIKTVVILAPSHHVRFSGASIWPEGAFLTPLGKIDVDQDLARQITMADGRFSFRRDVFEGAPGRPENSVETQLPFIQRAFPGARIVPIIVGYPPDPDVLKTLARALQEAVGGREDVLVNVSVDQSHFHPDKIAREIDERGLQAIEAMDIKRFWSGHQNGEMEVDGFYVVAAAMMYARGAGYPRARVLRYATSAETTGDASRVVGYASIMFYREKGGEVSSAGRQDEETFLTDAQKKRLLGIARSTLEDFVRTGRADEVRETDPRLSAEEGAFVTLHKKGQLRGCIGNIWGQGPLYQTIRSMAIAAASEDPRFSPVSADELVDIDVEVSVLSRPRPVSSADEIVLGRHGVIVSRGPFNRGVFLPQVATETGWSKERFLSELCSQKAGLPADCWRSAQTRLEIFTANVFGERE